MVSSVARRLRNLATVAAVCLAVWLGLDRAPYVLGGRIHAFGHTYDRYTPCCELAAWWSKGPMPLERIGQSASALDGAVVRRAAPPWGWLGDTVADAAPASLPTFAFLEVGADSYAVYVLEPGP